MTSCCQMSGKVFWMQPKYQKFKEISNSLTGYPSHRGLPVRYEWHCLIRYPNHGAAGRENQQQD